MTEIEQAFAELGLTGLKPRPNGYYVWGCWRIVQLDGVGTWYACDDEAPLWGNWPLRDVHQQTAYELAVEMESLGPKALTLDGYAPLVDARKKELGL